MERERIQTFLVVSPIQSTIKDQISEARNTGLLASSVADLGVEICKISTTNLDEPKRC